MVATYLVSLSGICRIFLLTSIEHFFLFQQYSQLHHDNKVNHEKVFMDCGYFYLDSKKIHSTDKIQHIFLKLD